MNLLSRGVALAQKRARQRRRETFLSRFRITSDTRLLDLGAANGSHIASVLDGTDYRPDNIYIADIDEEGLIDGNRRYGFSWITIPESGRCPFPDDSFDIVFCSSVIEHVTIPKEEIWTTYSGKVFKRRASERQLEFANEIRRLGRAFFVQTPCRSFPIESHTQLPGVGWLPRRALIPVIQISNKLWIKRTAPDWHLLGRREMARLFPDAEIVAERFAGLTKSVMAIRANTEGASDSE